MKARSGEYTYRYSIYRTNADYTVIGNFVVTYTGKSPVTQLLRADAEEFGPHIIFACRWDTKNWGEPEHGYIKGYDWLHKRYEPPRWIPGRFPREHEIEWPADD